MNPLFNLFEGAVMREILSDMGGHPHPGPVGPQPYPIPTEPGYGGYPPDRNCWDPSTWGEPEPQPVFECGTEPSMMVPY